MKNDAIAEIFQKMADILEFKGELPFKVNAYRKASRVIKDLQEDIETVWTEGRSASPQWTMSAPLSGHAPA